MPRSRRAKQQRRLVEAAFIDCLHLVERPRCVSGATNCEHVGRGNSWTAG
jgi:hypothetical protein